MPQVHFEVETASIGATLTAMAVNDNGQVLAAFSNGETGAVYLIMPGGGPRLLSTASFVTSIAFDPTGNRAAVADRGANRLCFWKTSPLRSLQSCLPAVPMEFQVRSESPSLRARRLSSQTEDPEP
jgi:hypothetical protein